MSVNLFKIIAVCNEIFKANNNKTRLVSQVGINPKYPVYVANDWNLSEQTGFDAGTNAKIEKGRLIIKYYNPTTTEYDEDFQDALDLIEQKGVGYENRLDQFNGHWKALGYSNQVIFLTVEIVSRGETVSDNVEGMINPNISEAVLELTFEINW